MDRAAFTSSPRLNMVDQVSLDPVSRNGFFPTGLLPMTKYSAVPASTMPSTASSTDRGAPPGRRTGIWSGLQSGDQGLKTPPLALLPWLHGWPSARRFPWSFPGRIRAVSSLTSKTIFRPSVPMVTTYPPILTSGLPPVTVPLPLCAVRASPCGPLASVDPHRPAPGAHGALAGSAAPVPLGGNAPHHSGGRH